MYLLMYIMRVLVFFILVDMCLLFFCLVYVLSY